MSFVYTRDFSLRMKHTSDQDDALSRSETIAVGRIDRNDQNKKQMRS